MQSRVQSILILLLILTGIYWYLNVLIVEENKVMREKQLHILEQLRIKLYFTLNIFANTENLHGKVLGKIMSTQCVLLCS